MLFGDYFGVADFIMSSFHGYFDRFVGKYCEYSALAVFGIFNICRSIICSHFLLYVYV